MSGFGFGVSLMRYAGIGEKDGVVGRAWSFWIVHARIGSRVWAKRITKIKWD